MTETWLAGAEVIDKGQRLTDTETSDPKLCLHTTETSGNPSYDGWSVNPHMDVMPIPKVGVKFRQFIPLEYASFALRHTRPQDTNRDNVIQIELIGTCLPTGPGYYWPAADPVVLRDLFFKVIQPICSLRGIPLTDGELFTSLKRLSDPEFDAFTGALGHANVPQNDHIDPQHFPWDIMLSQAKISTPQPPKPVPVIAPAFPLGGNDYYGLHHHDGFGGGVDNLNIRKWQTQMSRRGWSLTIDGKFGPQCDRVCRQFQDEKHLAVDGKVGPQTWRTTWVAPITR